MKEPTISPTRLSENVHLRCRNDVSPEGRNPSSLLKCKAFVETIVGELVAKSPHEAWLGYARRGGVHAEVQLLQSRPSEM